MDDTDLRQRFAERRATASGAEPSFDAVLRRQKSPRPVRRLALVTVATASVILAVTLWQHDRTTQVSASELMAWQASTDALLDFEVSTPAVPEEGENR